MQISVPPHFDWFSKNPRYAQSISATLGLDVFIIFPILIVELFAILQPAPTSEANVLFHPRVARQARMDHSLQRKIQQQ